MKKTVIALCGHKGGGKSTVAREIYNRLNDAMIIPLAGVAKQCVELITGIEMDERQPDGSYDYSQKAKTKMVGEDISLGIFIREFAESIRAIDDSVWINATFNNIESTQRRYYIIPDLRMLSEYTYLCNLDNRSDDYSVYIFRINPDEKLLSTMKNNDGRDNEHITETSIRGVCVDGEYTNSYGIYNTSKIAEGIVRTIMMYQ